LDAVGAVSTGVIFFYRDAPWNERGASVFKTSAGMTETMVFDLRRHAHDLMVICDLTAPMKGIGAMAGVTGCHQEYQMLSFLERSTWKMPGVLKITRCTALINSQAYLGMPF